MNDAELLQHVRSLGVKLWLDGETLRYSAPRGTLTPEVLGDLKRHKETLRAILRAEEDPSKLPPITPVPRDGTLPLSFAQVRFWLVDQIETNAAAFNIPFALRLSGKLDTDALQRTFEEVLRRHESLRTTFEMRDGAPCQIIREAPHWPLPITDLSDLPPDQREAEMRRLALASAHEPFDISRGPTLRTMLIRLDRTEHVFVVNLHPIASDGWSFRVLTRELVTLYQALIEGRPSPLPELTIQYADYAVWQRRFLVSVFERQLAYWKEQLAGVEPLDLPYDRPRPAIPARRGAMLRFRYPGKLAEALHGVVRRREGATLFMVLFAALHALLHRWTGQNRIVLSTQSAGRTRPELEDLVGLFPNTLLISADFSARNLRFRDLVEQVRERTLGAQANQDVPFERVLEAVEKGRNSGHTPLLQVMLINQNLPISSMKMLGVVMTPEYVERGTSQMDLVISARWSAEGIDISAEYDTELFDEATIRKFFRQYQMVLEAITVDPGISIAALPLLSTDERTQILREHGQSPGTPPEARSVLDIFEAQVDGTPHAFAVEDGAQRLTYRELELRANRLAWRLRQHGVGPEVRVAVCLNRAIDLVVAVWGVLKAGGAYVRLAPDAPLDEAGSILRRSGASLLFTQNALVERFSTFAQPCILVDAPAEQDTRDDRLPRIVLRESLACVHHAQDSTDQPQSVAVTHGSLSSMAAALRGRLNLGADDRVLQFASFASDTFDEEMYLCLLSGGCLVARSAATLEPSSFIDECVRSSITSIVVPTAFWHDVVAHLVESRRPIPPSLRRMIIGGEVARVDRVNQWKSLAGSGVRLWNTFGLAQTSGVNTACELSEIFASGQRVPIGRPVAGAKLYILDSYGQPVSVGTRGDLYIGGSGVSRGYLSSPSFTATRFVPDPFSEKAGARMFHTGEAARWLPDGRIALLGRRDGQVKVRGVRIELAEIERALSEHPSVRDATVVAQEQPGKGARLVAYVVPSSAPPPSSEDLRAFLAPRLPDTMLPAVYVFLDAHTPKGRVDRQALPALGPDHSFRNQADHTQLRTPVEQLVANAFAEVLQVPHVEMDDSFFALGGHSLLATQLVSRIRAAVGVNMPLRAFFDAPTVGGLAKVIEVELRRGKLVPPSLQRAQQDGDIPLSFAQQRLWFLYQLDPDSTAYHMPLALRLTGTIDVDAIQRSMDEVSRRHEALRTTFDFVDGRAVQRIHPIGRFPLAVEDLSRAEDREAEARRIAMQAHFRPFDLRQGPLIRAHLLRLGPEEHILVANMHHIIFDGWSMGVLVREIVTYYEAFRRGQSISLPTLPIRYVDYALWQRNWLSGEVLDQQIAFWRDRLAGITPLELPTDRPRPAIASHRGATIPVSIPIRTSDALRALARRTGSTLFMVLLAGFQALLHRLSGQEDFAVGSPIAGRTRRELEGIVGFFVNTLVLRADFSRGPTFLEFLAQVKEATLDAYAHQDLPFEKLVEELAPARDLSRQPLFQVMFALQNAPFDAVHLDGFSITPVSVEIPTAHFDLMLTMFEQNGEIIGALEYATDLFDAKTVERMVERLRLVLDAAVRSPEARVSDWHILTEQETRLLAQWNQTETAYPREACIHELFEAQVDRTPDAVALVWDEQALTFDAINRRANRLARHLRTLGVGPDVPVGLFAERSAEAIIALLAILKAGGMYVPLEPALPPERLSFIVHDTGLRLALVQPPLMGEGSRLEASLVPLDAEVTVAALQDERNLGLRFHSEQGAYVVFTSGSTGRPKGVLVPHRAVVRLAQARRHLQVQPEDVFLQYAPIAFDASTFEIWSSLLNGARVAIAPAGVLSLEHLGAALKQHRVTTLWLTAPLFHQVIDTCPEILAGVRSLLAGGDALSLRHVEAARRRLPDTLIINGYGPTENTTFTTLGPVKAPLRGQTVPLGTPIDQTRVHILDERLEPTPIGVPGELYASGEGLARGYLGRPGLTAERFVPDPKSGARMYRTGDRARWLQDGTLEFLGRRDHQVKIRGFRIELGEIEHALLAHPAVREAVVVVRQDDHGDKRLIAYFVPEDPDAPPPVSVLRDALRARLPEYMLPSAFAVLERMPLNKNGKVERSALPEPSREHVAANETDPGPRTPVEQILAEAFAEVLRLPRVGVHDDFFTLGGHSLLATQLVSRVRSSLGLELPLRALFQSPTVSGLAELVEVEQRKGGVVLPPIMRHERDGEIPLSFAQQRLWFLEQLAPGSTAYHMPFALRLSGDLDVEALRKAFDALSHRHESLRTTMEIVEGRARQKIHPSGRFDLSFDDLSSHDSPESAAYRAGAEEALRPFDLAAGPLFRVRLFRLLEKEHILLVVMHHIISDGWSMGVMMRELLAHYEAAHAGRAAIFPELSVQYADYAVWQRSWLSGDVLERQLAYWRDRLSGVAPLELPTDRPRPPLPSHRGASVKVSLGTELTEALHALARRRGATLFMVLLAGFQALLYRMSGQTDIAVGTPIAGRTQKELEGLIGFFVNTLVLRTDFAPNPRFLDLLGQVKEATLDAYAHQDIPFEKLVEELAPTRDLSRQPLFQVMFALQNTPVGDLNMAGLGVAPLDLEGTETAKFDLTLNITEQRGALEGVLEYATDLFDAKTVERMVERLRLVLDAAVRSPEARVSDWHILTEQETRLLAQWNQTETAYPREACIHELFEAQVDRTPDAVALVFEDERVTYAELERHANRLGRILRQHGVVAETRVALCLERKTDLIAALLGILKSGGAYVPLDPAYPAERLSYMLSDSGASLLLTSRNLAGAISGPSAHTLFLDEIVPGDDSDGDERMRADVHAENLAYLIYTSGSTGRPKGVSLTHRSAARFLRWAHEVFSSSEMSGVLAATSICFDLSIFEIFGPLTMGGTVVLARDVLSLPSLPGRDRVTLVNTVPSAIAELLRTHGLPDSVKTVNLAGEPLPLSIAQRIHALPFVEKLYNLYGPTEDTTYSTFTRVERGTNTAPTIGRPVQGTRGYVLDRHMQLVPVGVRGEFYLAGAGLARGYLDRPGLSAERFLPDPFGPEAGARMYRTGDLARWLPDGTLEYFGRADTQIKLRGFRIELGEIEAALSVHPGVRDAVVALRQDRLVAYIVAEPEPTPASLREHLGRKLPEYMIPAAFVTLAALPLSPNGKIDRRALPDPSREHVAVSEKDVAPRTPAEQALADLFAEVLRLPRVGVHDDFFGLGGHSLLATQLVSRVRSSLEIELPLRALFESPTVSGLAARVEVERRKGGAILPPVQRHGRDDELPLSFAQQRLWFLDQLAPGSTAYHMPFALRLSGPLDVEALRGAFEAISRRHEVLRTNIETFEGRARQKIHRPERFDLPLDDLSRHDAPGSQAYRLGAEEALRPFDLATGPLFRARLFRLRDQEHILVAVMHHIISDGWSMAIVMRELLAHYDAVRTGRVAILPELPVQYADYAVWQRKWLSGDVLQRQLAYWREKLSGVAPLELPADRPRPPQPSHRGGSVRISLTKGLTEALHALARRRGGTLFMVLLAGFQTLLHRMSDQTDIAVGTPIAGRTQKELEGLIGFFVNTLVLRTNFAQDPSFLELLEQVKETTLDAYAHQDIPFEKLVEEISPTRDLSRQPLFQVMFALQNTPLEASEPGGLAVARLDLEGAEAAKFDLTLNLTESEGALVGALVYASDLFDVETVQRMVERLGAMLEEAVRSPDAPVSDWPLLTAEESRLLTQWNATEAPYPQAACIHELFEAQVDRTPDALAVVFEDEAVTYDELDRRANGYASLLRAQGVGPEARVGLCLPRSVELIVAILGVLKAGGAYVPLDPSYPRERLEYMLQDSGARLLVTRGEPGESIAVHGHDLLDFSQLDAASDARLQSGVRPDNLAYIIYTSGSTGKPKGVMVAHRGACNLAETQRRLFGLGEGHRVLQFSRTSFDASVFELLLALPVGGCLVLARAETLQPGDGLASLLEEREIDAALLPPSALAVMSEEKLSRPALLWVGGEACPPEVARRWSQGRRLINAYGPTEITVCATMFAYEPFEGSLPIGRALPNTHVYVLDRNLRLAPLGVPGELYIGGVGLARGYEGRHGLTAERFLPDPFSPVHGARMYRTGDRARWLQRGNLEFLGRVDEQVKLRGFRIELGEIEAALGAHPGVRDAAVNLRGDRLVGYVVADPELAPSPSALREHLGRVLPDYMIPAAFVTLDALPLSPSGKVDRRALPEPTNEIHPEEARRSRDRLEFELATIWEDLLGIRGVGLRDDFFALGGHSLLAARLAARIESQIGRKLPLARLLRGATVEEVAAALREDPAGPRSPLVALQPRGTRAPLYCVHAIGGSALSYLELARALGDEQPLHALHASGLDEGEPANDVVKMAKHYVDALLETNPKDAIRLLGWSFGGLVAFEMARELEARGVPVEEIILVDTHLPTRMQDPGDVSLALLFAREHGMTLSIEQETLLITASPEERGALLSALAVEQGIFPIGMAETILRRTLGVYEAHLHALQNYVARRATLRMSLIRATGFPAFAEEVASLKDPTGGWGELVVPAPMVCDLPGDHFSLLRAPLVAEVARIVQGCSPRSSRGEYTHDV